MKSTKHVPGDYVREVNDTTKHYVADLRAENETLRALVASLNEEKMQLEEREKAAQKETDRYRQQHASIQFQISEIEGENHKFSQRYVLVEQQTSHLSNLYVASYRLHETLDRKEVLGIIQEIVSNIIGSEEMGIFEVDAKKGELNLVSSLGIDASRFNRVRLGQGQIGKTATTGEIYVAQGDQREGDLTACIPLKLAGKVTGAIAIFRMLPQKTDLETFDLEIFELLATQAGMALHCSKLHENGAANSPW
jgi:GAF domain-containing protein